MNAFLGVLLGLFIVSYVAIGILIARRPLIGRIALREAIRRPGQTTVLVLGLMIAAAAIFSIQVIFDTMYETNRSAALATWGRDDVEVSAGGKSFDPRLASQFYAAARPCGCVAVVQNAILTSASVIDVDREVGRANIQVTGLDFGAQERFGSFALGDGTSAKGKDLAPGQVLLTQPLADALDARAGDRLRVIAGSSTAHNLTVAGVVSRTGAGAYGLDRSMFTSLETAQALTGESGVNVVRVSASGDADSEIANGHTAARVLTQIATGQGLRVLEVKSAALDIVVKMSQNGRPFSTSFGVIIALAATALVANLVLMLGEERRPRLAVLRAMGLTRSGLIQLSVIEGAIYSALGALAGLPAGFLLGYILVHGPGSPTGSQLVFSVHFDSLLGAAAAAALINLVTVLVASTRTTRMAISSALRDLPEPSTVKQISRKWFVCLLLVGLAGIGVLLVGGIDWQVLGGGLVIAAGAGLLKGRLSDRFRYTVAGIAGAGWALLDYQLVAPKTNTPGPFAFAILVAVIGLSVVVATNLSLLDGFLTLSGRFSATLRATLRPTFAYSSRRPLRAGLVIAAFSIVMAILVLVENLLAVQLTNYRADSGGWDVQAVVAGTDHLELPGSVQGEVSRVEEFPSRTFFGPVNWIYASFQGTTGWHREPVTIFGLTPAQIASGMGFGSPSAWAAIGRDPGLVAATAVADSVVELATAHGIAKFRVAVSLPSTNGSGTSSVVPGLMGSQAAMDLIADAAPGALMFVQPAVGISAEKLSRDLQTALLPTGAEVATTRSLLGQDSSSSQGFLDFLVLLMHIGLLVGVTSLGALALRAVIERRRAIGTLRAIGYQPPQVLTGLLAEVAAIATAGILVGVVIAAAMLGKLITTLASTQQFSFQFGQLAITVGLVYGAALVVTILPAIRAARLRPAEALRVLS